MIKNVYRVRPQGDQWEVEYESCDGSREIIKRGAFQECVDEAKGKVSEDVSLQQPPRLIFNSVVQMWDRSTKGYVEVREWGHYPH